ncbi:MAG: 50S ribosomal protein L3 N(5)-glutamine methyltransferase [Gammaproteobacteria bacterium]|nr:50S ribosomal protein L3 N(5)-glutamine methyltransferase [Gammaproteobacteria bacterium]
MDDLHTVGDLVRWGASQLNAAGVHFGHGTDNAADESRVLIFHALSLDYAVPDYFYQARVTAPERTAAVALIQQRIEQRCPAAYLTGEAWFAGLQFALNRDVLVPRSPIAELIAQQFEPWCRAGGVRTALELGTGSGCIAIAIAVHLGAQVDAVDLSAAALKVAKANIDRHDVAEQVQLFESDLFNALEPRRYDLIVSNPPYVGDAGMQALPPEYRHEPELALAAGADGLAIVHRILRQAGDFLQPDGLLVMEVGESAASLIAACPDVPFEWVHFEQGGDGVFILHQAELLALADRADRCA